MPTLKGIAVLSALGLAACATPPQQQSASRVSGVGVPVSAKELAAWDISIPPSGAGLPAGGGTGRQGETVYDQKCSVCHGLKGVGKPADALAGGQGKPKSKTPP